MARARKATQAEKAVTGYPPTVVRPEDQPDEDVPPPIMPEDQTPPIWCAHCGSGDIAWVTTSPAANQLHFCAAHKPPEPVMEYAA